MSNAFRLICDYDVLTPLFLGGANQVEPELRTPSVKGALRFWYRALDFERRSVHEEQGGFAARESVLFGSGGEKARQALLRSRCRPPSPELKTIDWKGIDAQRFDQGGGRRTLNGLTYVGYPFGMGNNGKRKAFEPGTQFSLELTCLRAPSVEDTKTLSGLTPLRAALASAWALGHFGSLGSRSRRGFGALALTGWRLEEIDGQPLADDTDKARLPILSELGNREAWLDGAQGGLAVVKEWFSSGDAGQSRARHPHFGPRADLALLSAARKRADWRGALLELGGKLQEARQRQGPDYQNVKDHINYELRDGGKLIQQVPERAAFGLPISFRYGSVPKGRPVTFAPINAERHGSLLFLRPVLVRGSLYGLCLRLDGDVPGIDTKVGIRGTGRPLVPPEHNALDDFMRKVKGEL